MGEAKKREETGKDSIKKIYAENDQCPACRKKCSDMDKEHAGKLITLAGGTLFVCWRCGNIFFPQSRLKYLAEAAEKTLINPNSPEGQAIQQAASKLVLPGV
jgi:uncharacterized protein with PIN domain